MLLIFANGGFYEFSDEPSGSIKDVEFVYKLSNCQLFEEDLMYLRYIV
jgi:hypothetical protein